MPPSSLAGMLSRLVARAAASRRAVLIGAGGQRAAADLPVAAFAATVIDPPKEQEPWI